MSNSRGQALLESLVSLPFLFLTVSAILLGLHSYFTYYLIDHWVYRTSLCLERDETELQCRSQYLNRINRLPMIKWRMVDLHRSQYEIRVKLHYSTPIRKKTTISTSFHRPLGIADFKRAQ